jgi:hypothetical protein
LLNPKSLRRRTTFEVDPTFEVLKNLEGFNPKKNVLIQPETFEVLETSKVDEPQRFLDVD